jgi:hypothetical protein
VNVHSGTGMNDEEALRSVRTPLLSLGRFSLVHGAKMGRKRQLNKKSNKGLHYFSSGRKKSPFLYRRPENFVVRRLHVLFI